MVVAELLLIGLALTAALAGVGLDLWSLHQRVRRLQAAQLRGVLQASDARRLQQAQEQLAQAQRLSETAVAGSAQLVRAVHHGIAAIPFGILEAIPVTRDTTRIVHQAHDLISGAVYGSIQAINRGIGSGLRKGLAGGSAAPRQPSPSASQSAVSISARSANPTPADPRNRLPRAR